MAQNTVSNINKLLIEGAAIGFSTSVAPLSAFSVAVKTGTSALNDNVRVPFAQNVSGSATFSYATGYTGNGGTITGLNVQMSNILYQPITLNDSELSVLNDEAIVSLGRQAGAQLAADVFSNIINNCVTQTNFSNSGSYTSTNYSSSNALVALASAVNTLKWPVDNRSLIVSPGLLANLQSNPNVINAQNFGNGSVIQNGAIMGKIFGFTPWMTQISLPNSDTGFAVNPNGILVANGYHTPADQGTQYIAADQVVDELSNLTFGFRQWYSPNLATSTRVFDCLFGSAAGNPNAVYHIK